MPNVSQSPPMCCLSSMGLPIFIQFLFLLFYLHRIAFRLGLVYPDIFSVQFNFCVMHFFYKRPLFFSFLLIISAYLSSLCHLCLPIWVTTVCRFDLFTVCAFDFKQCQNNLLPPYVLGILVHTYITFIVDIII